MKPKPEALFRWGTRPRRLYEALAYCGEVTNYQIARTLRIKHYAPVMAEIGEALAPYGLCIARRRLGPGAWAYRVALVNKEQNI